MQLIGRSIAALLIVGVLMTGSLSAGAQAPAATPPPAPPAPAVLPPVLSYVALGDSIAAGVGASAATSGYVSLVAQGAWPLLSLPLRSGAYWNAAIPGETSTSMLTQGGQLERVVRELLQRQGGPADDDVRLITIGIGGNDFLGLLRPGQPCQADPA